MRGSHLMMVGPHQRTNRNCLQWTWEICCEWTQGPPTYFEERDIRQGQTYSRVAETVEKNWCFIRRGANRLGRVHWYYQDLRKALQRSRVSEEGSRFTDPIGQQIQGTEGIAHQVESGKAYLMQILTKQVNELKAYSCQTTSSQKRDFNSSSSDLSKFLKYQSKIAEHSDDESNE